jgi:glutathione S-transferase
MKLFGSKTSPFARKVRIVAAELGEPIDWVDTTTEAGSAEHLAIAPIRRVPVAILDGRTIFDSRVIIDWLITTRGYGPLAPPSDPWQERNVLSAIDATMESLIQVLYLARDGVAAEHAAKYARRQHDRTQAILGWLADKVSAERFGLPEVVAICALDWIDFRQMYPTGAALAPARAAWRDRPSIASTLPH